MGLEAPLALLGLLAAVLPLLVHRMRKRELPRITLPTFALLARAAAENQRKRSFTDLLLLVLRMALIVIASIAIAAPYVTARVAFGDGRVASAAIVIDDSLSMSRSSSEHDASLFRTAVERAQLALRALPDGSEVSCVLAGKPARVIVPLTKDLLSAQRKLEALPAIATRDGDLASAVQLAARELGNASQATRRMLVLSDFARHNNVDAATFKLDGIEVKNERLGSPAAQGNAYIETVNAVADPTQRGQTSIAVDIDSVGTVSDHAELVIKNAGNKLASASLVLKDGRAHATMTVHTPEEHTDPTATIELQLHDALEADNTAGLVLTRADAVRVLLVNGDPHPASDLDELHYVQRALDLMPEQLMSLSVRSVDPLLFARTPLADADVIVLANVAAPNEADTRRLREFVLHGGGLVIAAGSHVDAARYNAALDDILPAQLEALGHAGALHFAEPFDARFLPSGLTGLREATTDVRLGLQPKAGGGTNVLLSFDDGSSALVARDAGQGRCLVWATSLDADFSDLPLRPGFLPLLAAVIRSAAVATALPKAHLLPGDTVELGFPRESTALEVVLPDASTRRFDKPRNQDTLTFGETGQLGAYRVRAGSSGTLTDRAAFVVTAPHDESDLTPAPVPETQRSSTSSVTSFVHEPIGTSVFALAGLLVLGEGFLRLGRRRRS